MAEEVQANYADSAWLVRLEALTAPDLVPPAIAAVLSIHEQAARSHLETLTDALALRQLLLVLDNCEHLARACTEVADVLLQGCPRLQLLATSHWMWRASVSGACLN